MNIWMIEETREIEQTLQSVVSGWALTMPAVFFYTRKLGCNSRSNDKTPFWLVDQEQNSIWFVWVSPAPCISPLRELSLTSDRSAVVFFFSVCDIAPPTLRTTDLGQHKLKNRNIWDKILSVKLTKAAILRVKRMGERKKAIRCT